MQENLNQEFFDAYKVKNFDLADKLFAEMEAERGYNDLIMAIRDDKIDVVNSLIESGVSIEKTSGSHYFLTTLPRASCW